MTELLTLELVYKNLVTSQIVLTIGYDIENLTNSKISKEYKGEITFDRYGRKVPKHAHGTINLDHKTSSTKIIMDATMKLFERIINPKLLTRRITISVNDVVNENTIKQEKKFEQMDLFTNYEQKDKQEQEAKRRENREKNLQKAMINIKHRYGKNAIIKGMNLQEGGTTIERNGQIGGHKG